MKQGDKVFVKGNGMYCWARVECVPTAGVRAALEHIEVSVPANQGITRYTPDGRVHYWVEKKSCNVVAQEAA